MKMRLAPLILRVLVWLPLATFANQDFQARFEKSLKDARSLPNVEIEFIYTLRIMDPAFLNAITSNKAAFYRTIQYSYLASGPKYRATCKLISGSERNQVEPSEFTFDGKLYTSYRDGNSRYMTRGSKKGHPTDAESMNHFNPLITPFIFLSNYSDSPMWDMLRFTDIVAPEFKNELLLPKGQRSDGSLEISLPGLPLGEQPTTWKIAIDEAGDAFTPRSIVQVAPGAKIEIVHRLLNYTNLGGYQFPTRIEWTHSTYPPTSPPTLLLTGSVTVISARIPGQVPDSLFRLDEREKAAVTIWDWDQKKYIKGPGTSSSSTATRQARPKIYDESAAGSKQIAEALAVAKKEHKHVLLQFGANYCGPCHELHKLFETDKTIAEELEKGNVVVMIDVNQGHNKDIDTRYGNPTRFGLPAIVVLDSDGKQLTTQDTGLLAEEDHYHYNREKIMDFLKQWSSGK